MRCIEWEWVRRGHVSHMDRVVPGKYPGREVGKDIEKGRRRQSSASVRRDDVEGARGDAPLRRQALLSVKGSLQFCDIVQPARSR